VLRILDARTGEPVAAAPARRGLTRIEAYASGLDLTALRVLLTADLLVRALELGGTPVWATLTAPRDQPELRVAATTLAIRPFEDGRDLASGLGEAQAIHVLSDVAAAAVGAGPVVDVAPVIWREPRPPGSPSGAPASAGDRTEGRGTGAGPAADVPVDEARRPDPGGPARTDPARGTRSEAAAWSGPDREPSGSDRSAGHRPADRPPVPHADADHSVSPPPLPALLADPTALRLALLSVPRGETLRLDPAVLDGAAARLEGWRRAVAGWARQPSRPVPEVVRARLRAAWEDDLDLPGVLAVLGDVEKATDLPDGARFETFAYADRLLALELARDLGILA
jgi:hypothetical protein